MTFHIYQCKFVKKNERFFNEILLTFRYVAMGTRIWPDIKAHLPVSTVPAFVITCIYLDWSKTQRYKERKELESLGLQREFDKKIKI